MIYKNNKQIISIFKDNKRILKRYFGGALIYSYQGSVLPEGYTECEYLEGTGTQYIDTGITPNAAHNITTEVMWLDSANSTIFGQRDFGVYVTKDYNQVYLTKNASNVTWCYIYGVDQTKAYSFGTTSLNKKYTYNIDCSEKLPSKTYERPYYLFGLNNIGNILGQSKIRLYSFKIDGVIDLIPALDPSGKPCMYDTISKKAFYNQGTGEFLYKVKLPAGYTECEYLESTGTQWITTDKTLLDNKYTIDTVVLDNSAFVAYTPFFGNYNSNSGSGYRFIKGSQESSRITSIFNSFSDTTNSTGWVRNTKYSLHIELNNCTRNGESFVHCTKTTGTVSNNYLELFNVGDSTSEKAARISSLKIYSFILKHSGEVVMNLIPCLDADGVPCMYDTVSKQSYYNQGTGEFLYKVKLPAGYTVCEYLEGTGTQYIDTGIAPSDTDIIDIKYAHLVNGLIFGSRESISEKRTYLTRTSNYVLYYGNNRIFQTSSLPPNNEIIDLHIESGNTYTSTGVTSPTKFGDSYFVGNIFIFGINQNNNNLSYASRIYSFSIKDKINLIPCLDNNGIPCMYDTISKQSYYNQGTDEFLYNILGEASTANVLMDNEIN